MKTLLLTLTYLVGFGELILAWYFWKTHSGNEIRKVMALLAFSVGMWVLSILFTVSYPQLFSRGLILDLTYLFGAVLITAFLHFSIVFPYRSIRLDWLHVVLLYVPVIIFSYLLFFTDQIVQEFTPLPDSLGQWIEGPTFPLYGLYLTLLYLIALGQLVFKFQRSDGINRTNLRIVVWSVILGGAPGVTVYLVIPVFTGLAVLPLVGTLSTGIWLGAVTYIITRKV